MSFASGRVTWPIRIGCVDPKDPIPKFSMLTMQSLRGEDSYFICMETIPKGFKSNGQVSIWKETLPAENLE